MRYLVFFAGLYFLGYSIWHKPIFDKVINQNKDKIEVIFSNKLSQYDLDSIKTELKSHGIDISYNHTSFDFSGKLSAIDFSVDCNDGFKGTSRSNYLYFTQKVGFVRDYSFNSSSGFMIGNI
jgi:hypothetical protein